MSISTNENGTGIVYILTNPAMPDLLKIGFAKADVVRRIRDLSSSTSVPFPFECVVAKRVADAQALGIGTEIEFKYDRNMKATVAGTRKVIYEGEERWLSSLTQQLLDTTNEVLPKVVDRRFDQAAFLT